uniref:Helicase ATP-binding domain-containing protein n=1 Tax=Parastrongyloides trichosuri TaxID=131310 RepID=A0A0N4ZNN2_PARTI
MYFHSHNVNDKKNPVGKANWSINNVLIKNNYFHAIYGKVIEICDITLMKKNNMKMIKGLPLCIEYNEQIFEAVLMEHNSENGTAILKINALNDKWFSIIKNDKCRLLPSSKHPLKNTLDFLIGANFTQLRGWEVIKQMYRGTKVSVAYNDRKINFFQELNSMQKNAVKAALNTNRRVLCLSGPPGTGKTKVITEIISHFNRNNVKVLIVAPRSDTLTSLIDRMNLNDTSLCSMGNEDNVSLENKIKKHTNYTHLESLTELLTVMKESDHENEAKVKYQQLAENLNYETTVNIIKNSKIIFTTSGRNIINLLKVANFQPDVVLIEEGGQILECVSWRFLSLAPRAIVVGDHNQLSATLNSEIAEKKYLINCSVMESIWQNAFEIDKIMLNIQYRMNEKIMQWSSETFYNDKMVADENNKDITLSDISSIKKNDVFNSPLLTFNTKSSSKFSEKRVDKVYSNPQEALICVKYIKFLLKKGIKESDIGVITPYNGQKNLIEKVLGNTKIQVSSVDGFQGQQREVIVFCFVRNNQSKIIGFLNDERRMNVAITRARRQFVFIGSLDMLNSVESFQKLKNILNTNGVVIPAEEYLSDLHNLKINK